MGSLAIPLVLWGRDPPTHDISCILLTKDVKTLVTASRDGQICVWDFDPPKLKMVPRVLLVGHSSAVSCLAESSSSSSSVRTIASAAQNGEFCLWDLRDGRCLEVVTSHNVHTSITPYQMLGTKEYRLFCVGNYPEIHIYDPSSLHLLCVLSSRVNPDWIAAIHVLRPSKRNDEVVLGVTLGGWVKVWTVSEKDVQRGDAIKEHESKKIRACNAKCLVCCAFNQRTVLIVTPKTWQVYDAGDFSQLAECSARDGETTYSGGSFLSNETVLVWGESGRGYIYKLPNNCVVGTKEFHRKQADDASPILIGVCKAPSTSPLVTPPSWQYQMIPVQSGAEKLLVRGDSEGSVVLWRIKDLQPQELQKLLSVTPVQPTATKITVHTSLQQEWAKLDPPPVGLLDHVAPAEGLCGGRSGGGGAEGNRVCATLFLGTQGRVACGREDGSILLVPATEAIMLHLLHTEQPQHSVSQSMILRGHELRVTCLLYPHGESSGGVGGGGNVGSGTHTTPATPPAPRYPANQLVSGGADFAVIIWDLTTGAQLQRFVVQAGPVLQLMITPSTCSVRVQQCVVSVAGDHSVALLSLKEARVVLLAAHHPCPVTALKWRPLHDFMLVATQDGAVHVWQMETGHLDRVATGVVAEELLAASEDLGGGGGGGVGAGGDGQAGLANPAIHLLRGLRHRNLAAIRHAAQRGIQQVLGEQSNTHDIHDPSKLRCCPLLIQPLRTHPSDPHSHVLFVDVEALIVQLLADEYAAMSPESLEAAELTLTSRYQRINLLTHPASPEAAKKIADGGQTVEVPNQTLQIGQLVLSVLHSWGLNPALDATCLSLLGLLRPRVPPAFGLLTKSGFMSLFLPTWHPVKDSGGPPPAPPPSLAPHLPPELIKLQHATQVFSSRGHWEISPALSTQHLVALVALANTLQHRNAATLHPSRERSRRLHLLNANSVTPEQDAAFRQEQSKIKQGWSTLTALHSVLLPDAVAKAGAAAYQPPLLEVLARRWHSRCQEIRDAAQVLLQTELVRIGRAGRQAVIDEWAPHLPSLPDALPGGGSAHNPGTSNASQKSTNSQPLNGTTTNNSSNSTVVNGNSNNNTQHNSSSNSSASAPDKQQQQQQQHDAAHTVEDYHFDEDHLEGLSSSGGTTDGGQRGGHGRSSQQGVAIVLLAVIGAYHGHHQDEGFTLGAPLAVKTSKALAHLLLSPPTPRLPLHTPLRRAAIDLIGRGFSVWEPYLDVAKVVLALLELCADTHHLAPSMKYGLPLIPEADSCRTASQSLTHVAGARPGVLITSLAREVARYNTLQQNAQSLQMNLHLTTLFRAKTEILRLMEYLIQNHRASINILMVEVMDIILHCVDTGNLRGGRGLSEVFPAVCSFSQVSHCPNTRRIAAGSHQGAIALYDLRHSKCQVISAHTKAVTAVAFSPDGKHLTSYSMAENKLSFWQTSTGIFGLGSSQTKCTKSFSTVPVPEIVRLNPQRSPKLVWISNKTVVLMLSDGTEHRFNA